MQQMVPDPVIILLVDENVEVACQAIEKAAMDRAVAEIDESFSPGYEARRRHRQVCAPIYSSVYFPDCLQLGRGQPFWDSTLLHSTYQASLPEPLRLKPSGVQPNQLAVYEDFGWSYRIFPMPYTQKTRQALNLSGLGPADLLRPSHSRATTPLCIQWLRQHQNRMSAFHLPCPRRKP
jgi:hypothetical protein